MTSELEYCASVVQESDKDRFIASLFAPAQYRGALYALYAFDIETSRIGALVSEPLAGEVRLQWWHDAIAGTGTAAGSPIATALLFVIDDYRLPADLLTGLLDARRFDVYREPMSTPEELRRYAAATAGAIYALAARILGAEDDLAAVADAAALVTTTATVLQSLPRDASQGRIYVPAELLAAHGGSVAQLLAGEQSAGINAALSQMGREALAEIEIVRASLMRISETLHPAFLPLAVAQRLLLRMEKRCSDPFSPGELPQWRRQWILWRAARDLPKALAA
jgi:phytoene synthase